MNYEVVGKAPAHAFNQVAYRNAVLSNAHEPVTDGQQQQVVFQPFLSINEIVDLAEKVPLFPAQKSVDVIEVKSESIRDCNPKVLAKIHLCSTLKPFGTGKKLLQATATKQSGNPETKAFLSMVNNQQDYSSPLHSFMKKVKAFPAIDAGEEVYAKVPVMENSED